MKNISVQPWGPPAAMGLPPARAATRGFTVIELLIVVAIITILALLAIPAWRNYEVLNQVKQGLGLADSWKIAVANYYATVGNMPASEKALSGIGASTSEYVSGISVNNGQILITFGNSVSSQVKGLLVSITPELDPNNDIVWICGGAPGTLANGTELTPVKNTPLPVTDGTAVPAQYLPAECRAP
jgi:type IV pilus assembly protein PilA